VFDPNSPQLQLPVDREKVSKMGVPLTDVFATLQASLGGAYVNDFNRFGRLYRVFVQADADYRQSPEDIGQFYVRSATSGEMIPLSTLLSVDHVSGSEMTIRYNLARSVDISGSAAPGFSSAQAIQALEEVAAGVLPRGMGYEFSGLSTRKERANPLPTFCSQSSSCSCSWPRCMKVGRCRGACAPALVVAIGAFFGVWTRGMENNVMCKSVWSC